MIMGKYIITFGVILILLNTIIGFLLSYYPTFNIILVDINLILSTVLLYITLISKIDPGYRIAFIFIFIITGLCRIISSFFSKYSIQDNILILIMLGILTIEILIFLTGKYIKRFAD